MFLQTLKNPKLIKKNNILYKLYIIICIRYCMICDFPSQIPLPFRSPTYITSIQPQLFQHFHLPSLGRATTTLGWSSLSRFLSGFDLRNCGQSEGDGAKNRGGNGGKLENHGKLWENHGKPLKIMEKPWKNMGKPLKASTKQWNSFMSLT